MKVLNDQEMDILNHSNSSGVWVEGVGRTQQKKKIKEKELTGNNNGVEIAGERGG